MQRITPFPKSIFKYNVGVDNFRQVCFFQHLGRHTFPTCSSCVFLDEWSACKKKIIKQTQIKRLKRNGNFRQRAGHACESFLYKHLAAAQEHKYSKHFIVHFRIVSFPSFFASVAGNTPFNEASTDQQCGTTWISTMPMVPIPLA